MPVIYVTDSDIMWRCRHQDSIAAPDRLATVKADLLLATAWSNRQTLFFVCDLANELVLQGKKNCPIL